MRNLFRYRLQVERAQTAESALGSCSWESIMSHSSPSTYRNQLLANLPDRDLARLTPWLEPVKLRLHASLETPGQTIPFVYFPDCGLVSVLATSGAGRDIEVGLLGLDGMTGLALVQYDNKSAYKCVVQLAGRATRIHAGRFRRALQHSLHLRVMLTRYARAFGIQVAATAMAAGRAKLEARLARWLVMVHDRVPGDTIDMTHDYLAIMLGVRRPGVTVALHILEGKGLIKSVRGEIIIKDRQGLIADAAGTYGWPEAEYTRLTGIGLRRMAALSLVGAEAPDANDEAPLRRPGQ
jgi:CRP-like cAMP-binding protein